MREVSIAGHRIAQDTPAFIVAEIGHNHGGSVDTCKLLFQVARDCGADAVKLQKRENKTLFTPALYDSPYNSEHAFGPTYGTHREALEFGWREYQYLKRFAEGLGLVFFATAFDMASADFLAKLDVKAFKIASGDLKSLPLIKHVASYGKPVIVSTGGGTLADVKRVYDAVMPINAQLCLLQCTASYPVVPAEMNLRVIETYMDWFPESVIGLSDHQDGVAMGPVAYTLGARVFEKHFTLNHTSKGSDHAFSLEPPGLRTYVRDIHRVRLALGDGVKRPYESEAGPLYKMAKSLVAAGDWDAGHVLQEGDLTMQSPNTGLEPWKADKLYGRRLREPLKAGQVLTSSGVVE